MGQLIALDAWFELLVNKISGSRSLVDKNPNFLDVMLSWMDNSRWRFEGT